MPTFDQTRSALPQAIQRWRLRHGDGGKGRFMPFRIEVTGTPSGSAEPAISIIFSNRPTLRFGSAAAAAVVRRARRAWQIDPGRPPLA